MLTYNEFLDLLQFTDKTSDKKFNRYLKSAVDTYLCELIGSELVKKLKDGNYSELMSLVKECLALRVEISYIETSATVIGEGSVQRQSDFTKTAQFKDKEMLRSSAIKLMQSYEFKLITKIEEGDYPEWNLSKNLTPQAIFKITTIG